MTTSLQSGVTSAVTAATTPAANGSATTAGAAGSSTSTSAASSSLGIDGQTIAGNFQTFLSLLTTQLQNQDPTNPLDTNQFTQQLVEFAQVEQQLDSNNQLATLVSLQQSAQATQALSFVGQTVTVNGNTAQLANNSASWTLSSPQPANATINISNSSGQLVYSGTQVLQTGANTFTWNGLGNNGTQWPAGTYTMSVTAQGASGQAVTVSTVVTGVVNSVNLTQTPPVLSVNGQNFTINQIQSVGQG
jgi:flagellar basal-body rod modification protein FlgD